MGVDGGEGFGSTFSLEPADARCGVRDLALEVREAHHVIVDDADGADAGGGEIEQRGRAKAAGADDQNFRGLELLLAGAAHFRDDDVPGVTLDFIG